MVCWVRLLDYSRVLLKAVRTPPGAVRMPPGHRPDAVWISHCDAVLRFAIYSRISFCITLSNIIFIIFHVRLVHDKIKVLSK